MKTVLSLLLVMLPLIGLADSGFITYESLSGVVPACGEGFDCGKVLTSEWAKVGPIPLSAIGFFYYATVFILAIAHFLELDVLQSKKHALSIQKPTFLHSLRLLTPLQILILLTAAGALFSLYLLFLMGIIIQGWCVYCLISAAVSLSLFVLITTYVTQFQPPLTGLRLVFSSAFNWKYTHIFRPLFFLIPSEVIHDFLTNAGEWLGKSQAGRSTVALLFGYSDKVLERTIDGISFPNPVGLAAGFDYNGRLTQILPSLGFGFHTIGTVTLQPYEGNPGVRLGRFPKSQGLLVNKGLKSLGAVTIARNLERLKFHIPTGISIASTNKLYNSTREQLLDILQAFQIFEKSRVRHQYYELNISCPNTFGGEPFTSPARLEILLKLIDKLRIRKPMYIKMPIDQADELTLQLLKVAANHSIDGVIFGNLTKDKTNPALEPSERAAWQDKKGNVSGKPTWDRSNNLLKLVTKHYPNRFTVIGTGGNFSPTDIDTKAALGAELFQLITGMIYEGPQLIGQINAWLALKKRSQKQTQ